MYMGLVARPISKTKLDLHTVQGEGNQELPVEQTEAGISAHHAMVHAMLLATSLHIMLSSTSKPPPLPGQSLQLIIFHLPADT
jgi:hypothetical protein